MNFHGLNLRNLRLRKPSWKARRSRLIFGLVLAVIFFGMNGVMLARGGIRVGGDTVRYVDGAENLLLGRPFEERQATFLGYIAVVALCKLLGLGLIGVVTIQIAFAVIAAMALYDLARRLAGPLAGFITVGFFAAFPEFALWNTYILTDSLYISAVILTTWLIHKASVKKGVLFGIAALAVLATATIRPNGSLFIPIAGLYWMTMTNSIKHRLFLVLLLIVVASIWIVFGLPGYKANVQAVPPYQLLLQGEVVWGYEAWRLMMPQGEEARGSDLMAVLRYSRLHPLASLRLSLARVGACLIHIRPFLPTWRNLLTILFLLPTYALAVYGLVRLRREPLAILLASVFLCHLLLVAATFADWDGRFLLYGLPMVGVLGACGGVMLIKRWFGLPAFLSNENN